MSAPELTARLIATRERRVVVGNTAALVLAYAIPRALTFVSIIVAARVLGSAEFGAYTTAAAVAVMASITASVGMQPLLVRNVARAPSRAPEIIASAHVAKVGSVALMALALALTPLLGFPPKVLAAAAILGVGYAVGAFVDNLAAYFQGIEEMHVWTQASILLGLVSGSVGIALVVATRNLVWLCAGSVAGQAAALAWLLSRAPVAVRTPSLPGRAEVAALLRQLAPFAVTFIATTLYYRADVLLLAHWREPSEVGLYGAAYRFLDVTQALALAVAGALLPLMTRRRANGHPISLRLPGAFATASLLAAVLLFALREPIVHILYGPAYAAAAPLLAILALVVVPRAINMFALAALAGADQMRSAAVLYLSATAASVGINLFAIPRFGATGAAVTALVSETLLACGLLFALRAANERSP